VLILKVLDNVSILTCYSIYVKCRILYFVFLDKEKFEVQLHAADGKPTVGELAEQIFDVTKIPVGNQRLICKGK